MGEYRNIDISLIETRVPENILLKAEDVVESGQISGLTKKKDNLWEAIVIDRNLHFSIKIKIQNDRMQYCECNCNTFIRHSICEHILTLIFHLRKVIDDENKKTLTTYKKKKKTFNISELLKQLSKDELESFIASKARIDRNFKLLLQATFIEKIQEDQLAHFIESTFHVLTKPNEKIPANKLKTFLDISDELFNHFKNLIANEDLIDAYNLAFLLLKKSFYIKYHLKTENARFYKQHAHLLSNYIEVYKLIEAPEYKEHINSQLEELLSASYISANLKKEKDLWMLFYDNSNRRDNLRGIIDTFLTKGLSSDYNSMYFVKMLQLILSDTEDDQVALIEKMDLQECYRLLQILSAYSYYPSCQLALHLFYLTKRLNHPLAKLVIENIEILDVYRVKMIDYSINYFIKFKDISYTSFIENITSNWKRDYKRIIEKLKQQNDSTLLVKFHLAYNELNLALSILENVLTWELLKKFDREIALLDDQACKELYFKLLSEYLSDHFGIHAQEFLKTVFKRMELIGHKEWQKELKLRLEKEFPERKSLTR